MSTSFIDLPSSARLCVLLLVLPWLWLAGCASKTPVDTDFGLDTTATGPSKYADEREGGEAAASDAVHVPPVPHDPAVTAVAEQAIPEYVRALQAMRAGKLNDALIMLQSLSSRYPQLSGPLVNQGLIYRKQGDFEAAETVLREALLVNSQNPYAHNTLGLALREQGKFDQALDHYRSAITLDPKYARAHFNLGVLAELYLRDLPLALDHFRRYQELQREQDQTVANWIVDLERRVPAVEPKPSGAIASPQGGDTSAQEIN